jgi:ElaB/YqjD/DUF883 family membrane-anchored ribosome-binding protein
MAKQKGDFYDWLKSFAEKTENLIDKQVEKLEKKGVLDRIEKQIDKAGDFVGDKITQFKNSDVPDKVDNIVDKTDKKAREVIEKSQETGDKISEKVEGVIDDIKRRTSQKPNDHHK